MATNLQDQTTQDLDRLLAQAKSLKARYEPIMYLNLMFYLGDQWVFWNRGRLDRPRLDPWRVTLTQNMILPFVEKQLARLTKQKPNLGVIPTTGQDEDLQAAQTGEKVLEFLWRHLDLDTRLEDVLRWAETCGIGLWKVWWDSAKGEKVQILTDEEGKPVIHPETGAPAKPEQAEELGELESEVQPKTIATGDVQVEVVSPFEFFVDPIARELHDAEWCIQVVVKSVEWVKQHFGIAVEPDTEVAPGPAEARLFPSWQLGGTSSYKGVKIHEYWCRPNDEHPEGRRAVWVKGKFLQQGPNPYKCLPYVPFKGSPVPGRFWPTTVVEQLKSPQTELNKAISQITENAQRFGNPALLASRQSNIQYSGTPGERIDFDDTTQNAIPSYLQAPQLPAYVTQQVERMLTAFQDIGGQHEVSNAQVPAGVKAASAINLLQEADDTRLGPKIRHVEKALSDAGSMMLELVASYWTEERTIQIAGTETGWNVMQFRGAALKGNTHVEVQAGSAIPRSKAAQQAATQDVLNLMFQYEGQQPIKPRKIAQLLKDREWGDLAKLFYDIDKDEAQIERENGQIAQGEEKPINAYDNHQAHIEGHEEFQRTSSYEYLDPLVKQAMERHILLHRQELLQQQLAAQPQPQLPGGPPSSPQNGNQPAPAGQGAQSNGSS